MYVQLILIGLAAGCEGFIIDIAPQISDLAFWRMAYFICAEVYLDEIDSSYDDHEIPETNAMPGTETIPFS